jgi:AcrR family transcriptional regulator
MRNMGGTSGGPTPDGVPERVVQATIGLLAEQGPSAIKARTVASASGLSTMAVYHHFGGIAELIRAVADHGFTELGRAFSQVPVTEDPIADLFAMALMTRRVAHENPHLYDLIVRTVHSSCDLPTAVGFGRSFEWTLAGLPGRLRSSR